jgi:hypothetical protein
MTYDSMPPLRIKTPCPKTWEQLSGDDSKRFCSECSLHVHNSTALTRAQARQLVERARERVCMRLEFDVRGQPIFRDSPGRPAPQPGLAAQLARWALAATAGLAAACQDTSTEALPDPTTPGPQTCPSTSIMGRIGPLRELGDVVLPDAEPRALLGEMEALPPDVGTPETPRDH